MPDDLIRIDLERDGEDWTARIVDASRSTIAERLAGERYSGGSPAWALETLGQELDQREAARLTRAARGETGPVSVEEALERRLLADVANVVDVLEQEERRRPGVVLRTVTVAQLSGIAAEQARAGAMGDDGRMRTLRALRRAESDGVVRPAEDDRTGDLLWRIATDDELEEAKR